MFSCIQYNYDGAKVLVTGGSSGIGLACARAYHEAGASVSITGRQASAGDYDHDLSPFDYRQLELTDREQLLSLTQSLDALDILVANAGGGVRREWSHDGFDQSLDINLASMFHLSWACKSLLEASQLEGGASIIGIASMTSYFGGVWTPGYGPAKAGIVQLVKTLGQSWGELGIRANAVAAGLTRTNLTASTFEHMPDLVNGMLERQGVKRAGVPEDIAPAVLFLTSPAASWITGQTLPVDGGFSVGH